jgi:hypothetical protein
MEIIWKCKACSGMDMVERITFIREGTTDSGEKIIASAVHIPSYDKLYRTREQWTDEEIDAIGNNIVEDLDEEINRKSLATTEELIAKLEADLL